MIKSLIAATALSATMLSCGTEAAYAQSIAAATNQAGGQIVLTDEPCHGYEDQPVHMLYSTDKEGNTVHAGCYFVDVEHNQLIVKTDSGDLVSISMDDFVPLTSL